jgi:hypothetical protein
MTDSSIYAEIAKAVPVVIGGALAAVAGVATQFVTHHLAISRDKGNVKRERLESFVKAMVEIGIETKAGLSFANRCRWFADKDDMRDWSPSPKGSVPLNLARTQNGL